KQQCSEMESPTNIGLKVICFKYDLRTKGSKTELEKIDNQNEALSPTLTLVQSNQASPRRSLKRHRSNTSMIQLRAFTLRVAEEEDWTIARKISKLIPNEGNKFKNLIEKTRKQARSQEGYSVSYSRKVWQAKKNKFGIGVQEQIITPLYADRKVVEKIHKPEAVRYWMEKRHMEPDREQGTETLQIDSRAKKIVREGSSTTWKSVPNIFGTKARAETLPSGNRFEKTKQTVAIEIDLFEV
ncbi:19989_t:CDS:2, partial [Gigaspora rosea]